MKTPDPHDLEPAQAIRLTSVPRISRDRLDFLPMRDTTLQQFRHILGTQEIRALAW